MSSPRSPQSPRSGLPGALRLLAYLLRHSRKLLLFYLLAGTVTGFANVGLLALINATLAGRATQAAGTTALQRMESSESLPPGLRERLDMVLIMLHGPRGEDGTIQGLLELAGDRAPFIDQAQSLNLFIPADVEKWDLLMLHFRAWELGIKSLYYLRSK